MNKRKIFNDPVYGFLSLPFEFIFDLIEHPYFQRLRHIKQLGLTHYVYPGAIHTRFHHALGALHLMGEAIDVLRSKGQKISDEEAEAASIAILLHDIGHGPYSHALERCLLADISHEQLTVAIMQRLNEIYDGRLDMALEIFNHTYQKKFLHQLISSQLDVDRLDYLNRDSFFTGVYEGVIGYDRIIKMMVVQKDELMIEAKGIYSIEKFIIARRLMYWQVYLHKTVLGAEQLLVRIIGRAKELARDGKELFATPALKKFLYNDYQEKDFVADTGIIDVYTRLDDYDVFTSIKVWVNDSDKVLSELCKSLVNRRLLKVELQNKPFKKDRYEKLLRETAGHYNISEQDAKYLVFTNSTSNSAYDLAESNINILYKDGTVKDITMASDQLNISFLSSPVVKYYLCFPKTVFG